MHLHQIPPPPSSPSPTLRPQSLQISVFSLSVFYPPPYARLALAAPCFLNLSSYILFGSLLGSSNTRSEVLLSSLLSILHESSSRLELVLFSPFFPHPLLGPSLSRPLSLSLSFSLSSCPLHAVSLTSTSSTALSFAPPFPVTIQRSRAAGGTEKRRP